MRKLAFGIVVCVSAAQAEPVTIAALGDSLTQGYGLVQEDGFVPQLERWLADNGADVTLINAGVSGDTTAGGLSRVAWTLTPDIDAMIVALGGNDLLRGIDPAISRANLRGILEFAATKEMPVLLVGMRSPGNYGPEYKAAFDAIYPELAAEFGATLYPSFLEALTNLPDRNATIRQFMQGDGIHPNRDGVRKIVEDMGPAVLSLAKQVGSD